MWRLTTMSPLLPLQPEASASPPNTLVAPEFYNGAFHPELCNEKRIFPSLLLVLEAPNIGSVPIPLNSIMPAPPSNLTGIPHPVSTANPIVAHPCTTIIVNTTGVVT
ncbi:hypothetical protein E2562_034991 [Oryza meyeriana var. granulata]|uniref:Uncharacterized protein n=1 Tax=Oryza meyeriana var. granulata TaxID=110450 RepID=A0A6G1CKZ9_9ORYZ|nr:hypothetical protein E2562_034991 [Oryza meyeriana var. granulata]